MTSGARLEIPASSSLEGIAGNVARNQPVTIAVGELTVTCRKERPWHELDGELEVEKHV